MLPSKRLSLWEKSQKQVLENAKWRYAQVSEKPLQEYLKLWRTWAHAGLPQIVSPVNEILMEIIG